MKTRKFFGVVLEIGAVSALLFGVGCGLFEPGDSTPKANQAPETVITSGPRENSTNSYFVRIAWDGQDQDGRIDGFQLTVDNGTIRLGNVTRDSTFKFTAANQDEEHTVSVAAIDDDGDVDPTPATLRFRATNVPPNTSLQIAGTPVPGATFGRGGIFTIVAEDVDNGGEFSYRFNIDNGAWSDWQNEGEIEFSINSTFGLLPDGQHTFVAQVRDAAMAIDETPVEFRFVVSAAVKPGVVLNGHFNGGSFYEDNSVFSDPEGNAVSLTWSPTFNYAGAQSSGSRYRIDGGTWTEYSTAVSTLELTSVPPGLHTFEVQFRDLGGVESDVATFNYQIVAPTFDSDVLVIDDGDGRFVDARNTVAGDTKADQFYSEVLTAVGVNFTHWDIKAQGSLTPGRGLGRYSTVLWQSDENFVTTLPSQVRVLGNYLDLGGNLWLVGWKPIQQLGGSTPIQNFDPVANPNQTQPFFFVWNYLKISSTRQSLIADFVGATGQAGYPNVNVDAAKNFNPNAQNRLAPIDVFTVRSDLGAAEAVYRFVSSSGNPDFQNAVTGLKYAGADFRVVVFSFPLYHLNTAEAVEAARKVLVDLGEI